MGQFIQTLERLTSSATGPWNLFHSFIHSFTYSLIHSFIKHRVQVNLAPAIPCTSGLICRLESRVMVLAHLWTASQTGLPAPPPPGAWQRLESLCFCSTCAPQGQPWGGFGEGEKEGKHCFQGSSVYVDAFGLFCTSSSYCVYGWWVEPWRRGFGGGCRCRSE